VSIIYQDHPARAHPFREEIHPFEMIKGNESWLEYSVTRAFTIPHLTSAVLILGSIWIGFVTVISFAAVGYETVSVRSTPEQFNSTTKLWYEKVFPSWEWIPNSRDCDSSQVKIQDCISLDFKVNLQPWRLRGYSFTKSAASRIRRRAPWIK